MINVHSTVEWIAGRHESKDPQLTSNVFVVAKVFILYCHQSVMLLWKKHTVFTHFISHKTYPYCHRYFATPILMFLHTKHFLNYAHNTYLLRYFLYHWCFYLILSVITHLNDHISASCNFLSNIRTVRSMYYEMFYNSSLNYKNHFHMFFIHIWTREFFETLNVSINCTYVNNVNNNLIEIMLR